MRLAARWLAWWLALFWLWLLLAGAWNAQEWVAAAAAAAVGASFGELARARMRFDLRLPAKALADVPSLVLAIFVDFGILVWALLASLARRRIVRGSFRTHELKAARGARAAGVRTWIELAATYSPNAYVVDLEPEGEVLLHDLVPRRSSESPAT